jgi:hypothetical protein
VSLETNLQLLLGLFTHGIERPEELWGVSPETETGSGEEFVKSKDQVEFK